MTTVTNESHHETTLHSQVADMVRENQNLRVKSENDDKTIYLMRAQYDTLAAEVDAIHDKYRREIRQLKTERDQAVRKFKDIDTILQQAGNFLMQAFRARVGDQLPEISSQIEDARLPGVVMLTQPKAAAAQ